MFALIHHLPLTFARSAIASAFVEIGVFWREFVAIKAMGFLRRRRSEIPVKFCVIMPNRFLSIADTATPSILVQVRVLWRVLVSLWTMRLFLLTYTGVATATVNLVRHRLDMIRIAATRMATQMVEFHPFRNRPDEHLVNNTMDRAGFPPIEILPYCMPRDLLTQPSHNQQFVAASNRIALNAFWEVRKLHAQINQTEGSVSTTECCNWAI